MKSVLKLTSICLIVTLLLAVTNMFTAPIIEKNLQSAATQSLSQVLPGAKDFEKLTVPDSASTSLKEIYRETEGLGYAVTVEITTQYSNSPMLYTVGVGQDGVITGIVITSYNETKDFGRESYPQSYVGKDSALNGVELVGGVTYSSTAFKQGVKDVFDTLISMGLINAGEKDDEQKLQELIDTLLTGAVSPSGKASVQVYESGAEWVKTAYAATNGTGYILVAEDMTVCVVNPFGKVRAYTLDGKDITDETENLNDAAGAVPNNAGSSEEKDKTALSRLAEEDAVFEPIQLNTLSTVTNAFEITQKGETYYGFVCHPVGYNNGTMTVYGILDEKGSIAQIKVSEFILYSQYYEDYTLNEEEYINNLKGKTESTLTESDTLISGATISASAVKTAITDMFEAQKEIKEGQNK